jgi:hypothetical protein
LVALLDIGARSIHLQVMLDVPRTAGSRLFSIDKEIVRQAGNYLMNFGPIQNLEYPVVHGPWRAFALKPSSYGAA